MNTRITWAFLRRNLPWAVLLSAGVRWGLFVFERHIRADQHAQDLAMFKQWVAAHIDQVGDSTGRKQESPGRELGRNLPL